MSALRQAVEMIGGQTALAEHFGISPQSVQQWVMQDRVPASRVIRIEAITSGQVTRHQLRPDLYPEDVVKVKDKTSDLDIATVKSGD
ncbi:transcriptional regulator [Aliamphritea hakodatensis]|uniref:transcriptional regulator n=1 Tax=Aliamphritea hakodatensis TaxID=2895352 RepID=UPI0022FD7154|nr:Cro/CI family transcriptional regulator [Aliamphritea hakodatensis]